MEKQITMLCPVCQTARSAKITCTDYGDLRLWMKPRAKCPQCNTCMYEADESLVLTLQLLNSAGIFTLYHCSNDHPGSYGFNRLKNSDERWILGPYIIMQDMDETVLGHLRDVVDETRSGAILLNETDGYLRPELKIESVTVEESGKEPESHKRITLEMHVKDATEERLHSANNVMRILISTMLERVYAYARDYKGFSKKKMAHCVNTTWVEFFDSDEKLDDDEYVPSTPQVFIKDAIS